MVRKSRSVYYGWVEREQVAEGEGTVFLLFLGEGHVALGAVVSPHDDGDAADGGSIAA